MSAVQFVRGQRVRRCQIVASGAILRTLLLAALNAQAAGRGDAIAKNLLFVRIVLASGAVDMSNPDGTGTIAVPAALMPFEILAVDGAEDTYVAGGATLNVEVYFAGNESIP